MVAIEQDAPIGQIVLRAVREAEVREPAASAPHRIVMRDPPERDQYAEVREQRQSRQIEKAAGGDFRGQRLGSAAACI